MDNGFRMADPTLRRSQTALRDCLIPAGATLRDAMVALDRGALQIVLVLDDRERLVGTVTDGDLRRALLAGASLDGPVEAAMQKRFTTVDARAGRAEVLDLMRARSIHAIPILDQTGHVAGVHLLREIIGAEERPNWAVIMAGGRGLRLRPMTETLPKPMLPVAGRPILERIVLHLVGFGIRRLFIAVHYLGRTIEDHFGDGADFGARIEYLREAEPGGSGGALALLPAAPAHPLLVMNGDLVTQADVAKLLDFHESGGLKATIGIRPYQHAVPFGCVEVRDGRVIALEEKPLVSRLISAGIYALAPDLPARVPQGEEFPITALVSDCLARGEAVGAFPIEDDWIDVGHDERLRVAREGGA